MLRILVTNDDGVNADGLWTLAADLKDIGEVTVVAPDREQSGVGTSMSFHHPIRLTKIHEKIRGINTYSVEGTPADSVIMAIKVVMKDGIDLVVSGINQGPNCGYDVFLSGTVGAALQGFFYSIPSIAISMNAFTNPMFATGARVARELAEYVMNKGLKGKLLLNVNVPDMPLGEIQGVNVTRLGEKIYSAGIETGNDGRHDYYWIMHRGVDMGDVSGTDLWALKHNRISITPLRFNRSEYSTEFVKDMAPAVARRLLGEK
jgi:5'-nucleotidase